MEIDFDRSCIARFHDFIVPARRCRGMAKLPVKTLLIPFVDAPNADRMLPSLSLR
jgi:hypothetical protein